MNTVPRLAALALLAACASLAPGCGGPVRRELTVTWTFGGGLTCAQAGIASVQVQIPGEALNPDTFACGAGAGQVTTGADLGRFLQGDYDITITGLDTAGGVAAEATQSFRVGGSTDTSLAIDVPLTSVTVRWTFAGLGCAAAGNPTVQVTLDGQPLTDGTGHVDLPCAQRAADNSLQDGIAVSPLDPGAHTFGFTAFVNGQIRYSLQGYKVSAVAGQGTEVAPDLPAEQATSAAASVDWTFTGLSCAEAQVSTVRIDVDGTSAGEVPCSSGGNDGGVVTGLSEGSHILHIVGFRAAAGGSFTVYDSAPVAQAFYAGKNQWVPIDAAASAPAIGDATLTFAFAAGGPACTSSGPAVASTLNGPGGATQTFTVPCGNGLVFCDPRLGSCPAGALPGLAPGVWSFRADAPAGGRTYTATGSFAVANQAGQGYTLTLQ